MLLFLPSKIPIEWKKKVRDSFKTDPLLAWPPPWASLVAQIVKNLPAMWETLVRSLGWEDPLEEEMATHFSTLAWESQTWLSNFTFTFFSSSFTIYTDSSHIYISVHASSLNYSSIDIYSTAYLQFLLRWPNNFLNIYIWNEPLIFLSKLCFSNSLHYLCW